MKTSAAWFKNMGVLTKLLILLGYIANKNLKERGILAVSKVQAMGKRSLESAEEIGKTAIEDSVFALDRKSTEVIELRTVRRPSALPLQTCPTSFCSMSNCRR